MARSKRDEKIDEAELAEQLLEMTNEWKEQKERELLAGIAKQEIGDIAEIQADYKASLSLISFLKTKIAAGKIATAQIKKDLEGGR